MHYKFGVQRKEMLKQHPQYPKTSICQHSMKLLGEIKEDKRKFGKGCPRKLTERDDRSIIRSLVSLRENVDTFPVVISKMTVDFNARCQMIQLGDV